MAKNTQKTPGRFSQMWEIWKLTAKTDKTAVPLAAVAGIAALGVSLLLGFIGGGSAIGLTVWSVLGLVAGVITFIAVISRRAERMAYSRIEGQAGAVGAILSTILKRGWSGSEEPVALNARSQDLLYRVAGRGGIVLIAEGHRASLSRLVEDEKRKLAKVANGVPVSVLWVCGDEHSVRLGDLAKTIFKLPKVVRTAELGEINRRLSTMRLNVPVPKGIDPTRVRGMSKPR
ncbi:MAG: hypothetical protein RJA35_304 [Actinomycetota bacterium]